MAALTREEVQEIAALARLHLEPDEVERLRVELGAILGHMDRLRALDTEGVEPMTHAVPMSLRLRDDEIEPSLAPELALGQAPHATGDLFQVPAILKARS